MERLESTNSARIAWCCADFGLTPDDLAREVGISHAAMHRAMAGEAGLTFSQLSKIASFFGRGVLFFLEPGEPEGDRIHTVAFRTIANQKPELSAKIKALVERVEHQRTIFLALKDELGAQDFPRFEPPELPNESRDAAIAARRWLALPERNSFETYRAAIESKGILVFLSNGYQGKWQIARESPVIGFSLYDDQCPVIVVKKQRFESQQTFTLIHELGHILLQRMSSIDDEYDLHSTEGDEHVANAFSGHLLVPDPFLDQIDIGGLPPTVDLYDGWLERYRRQWGVSTEVILRRLTDSGRLRRERYGAYREWRSGVNDPIRDGGNREWRHREPAHIFGDTFVRAVLDAMHARYISLSKASSYLDGLKISDLHKLESYYAGL